VAREYGTSADNIDMGNSLIKKMQYEKEMKEWENKNLKRKRKKKLIKKIVWKSRKKIRKRKGGQEKLVLETPTTSNSEKDFINLSDLENMEQEGTLIIEKQTIFE
jgi:hypothetical protein